MPDDTEDELPRALLAMSRIVLGGSELTVVLERIAQIIVTGSAQVAGVSIRLMELGRADVTVHSSELTAELDGLQRELGEGPTLAVAAEATSASSGSLGGERRWPGFGPRAGRAGMHSVLALPLLAEGHRLGSLTLYAHAKDAFDESATGLAVQQAEVAAAVLRNAQQIEQARRLVDELRWATAEGAVVERAVGILMSRRGSSATDALNSLRELSKRQNLKLVMVCEQLVDEAVRRAQGRTPAG